MFIFPIIYIGNNCLQWLHTYTLANIAIIFLYKLSDSVKFRYSQYMKTTIKFRFRIYLKLSEKNFLEPRIILKFNDLVIIGDIIYVHYERILE